MSYSTLRTLLSQVRPVEIVMEKDTLPPELVKMLKNQTNPPIMNIITSEKAITVPKV